jgi:hypothetical protein
MSLSNELPSSWSFEEIAKATPPYGHGIDGVYVLAWQVRVDGRFQLESCLAMRVLDQDDGYGRWDLAHLCRRPADKDPDWRLSWIHVTGAEGTKYWPGMWIPNDRRFKDKPTNKEIYAALESWEEVRWSFEPEAGWTITRCGVCEQNWLAVIGEKPSRFFRQ